MVTKIRMVISNFEFVDSFWSVEVPPNLQQVEQDETIRSLLNYRVNLASKLSTL